MPNRELTLDWMQRNSSELSDLGAPATRGYKQADWANLDEQRARQASAWLSIHAQAPNDGTTTVS